MNENIQINSSVTGNILSGSGNVQINGPVTNIAHFEEEKSQQILGWLSDIEYQTHHFQAAHGKTPGTCTWLLKHPSFMRWRSAEASSVLWLKGDPGVGKTKLVSAVIDELSKTITKGSLAYFYCNRNEATRRDPQEIFCSLLKQISTTESTATDGCAIRSPVSKDYDRRANSGFSSGRPRPEESAELITQILNDDLYVTFIVIDALDEVESSDRDIILETIDIIVADAKKPVMVFVSSRNEDDIFLHFDDQEHVNCIYIRPENNASDIESFIEERLSTYIRKKKLLRGKVRDELRKDIFSALLNKAGGMFLWVDLQLQHLCLQRHKDQMEEALASLPRGLRAALDQIYNDILQQPDSDREIALAAMQLVLGTVESFTLEEFVGAIYCSENIRKIFDIETILSVCRNLIVFEGDLGRSLRTKVRFNHLSTREYLEKVHFTQRMDSQAFVLKCELRSLTDLEVSARKILRGFQRFSHHRWEQQLFVRGPRESWGNQEERSLLLKYLGTFEEPSTYFSTDHHLASNESPWMKFVEPKYRSPLFPAATLGLDDYLRDFWVSKHADLDIEGTKYKTPLILAIDHQRIATARLLIEGGADPNRPYTMRNRVFHHSFPGSPLAFAASTGNLGMVSLLIECGAIVSPIVVAGDGLEHNRYQTPMNCAIRAGHEPVVRFLIEKGADLNFGGGGRWDLRTPLDAAAIGSENLDIIRVLIENGAIIGVDAIGGSPLTCAAASGKVQVMELLLESGADVNLVTNWGTPLIVAAEFGRLDAVQWLLDRGADPNSVWNDPYDGERKNALRFATKYSYHDVADLLIQYGAKH